MKPLNIAAVGLLLAAAGIPASAQQTPGRTASVPQAPKGGDGEIRGAVVDAENNTPISAASVAVWSRADSSLVTGAVVREDGSFRIQGLTPGTYYLKISALGYNPQTTNDLALDATARRVSAGSVRLARSAVMLEAIEVKGERTAVAISPDRNSYLAKDVAPAEGTATDVLRAVPSVQVDGDGKVSLRGNENVAVQINGRPAPIRGARLAGYLQQLPSNMIERVEVIPNPSAKHDPEGMAGIINIVMKQNVDLGVSGGITLGAATAERYNASGNLGYQRGPLTTFFSYGFNSDERHVTGINDRERYDALRAPLSFVEQDIAGDESNGGHNLSTNVDYRLSEQNVLSTSLMVSRRESSNESLSAYTERNGGRSLLSRYDRVRDTETDNSTLDYTLAFKRTLEPQRHELSTELRFNRSEEEDRTGLWRQPLTTEGASIGTPLDAQTDALDARTRQLTAQGDYTRMLASRTKLETGYKGNARWLDRDFQVLKDSLGSGDWVRSDLSNGLELDEQVHAVYGVLNHGAGKVEMQAGLRAERASRDFSLASSEENYPHSYTSLFPSGLLAYNLDDASKVKLSYSRRIRRPGTQELNPFPVFFDVQNVFIGNPQLDPEYTDAIELGYQRSGKMGSLQVSPFYRRTTDIIRFIINTADTVANREVTSVSFKNLASGSSWGTDVNGSVRLGQRFNGFASFNVFKMVTEGTGAESSLSSDAVTWSGRVNGTVQLTPTLTMQGMYFYRAPMNIERGRFSSFSMTDFSLRKKLYGEKASVSLRVADPFDMMGFRVEAGDDNLTQITERQFDARAVHLTFQYNFGQAPKIRQRRPDQGSEPQSVFP